MLEILEDKWIKEIALLKKNKKDMSSPEYYKKGNSNSKSALQKLCQEEGIAYLERNTRQELAEALADNFRKKDKESKMTEDNISLIERKQAFMNRMMKHWFMHPFTTPNNSAIKVGTENESITLKVLHNYLRSFSNNTF